MRHALILIGLLVTTAHDVSAMEIISFIAPTVDPVAESCLVTDENACDDGNPCTLDECFQKLRSTDNLEFRFNGVCQHTVIEDCAVGLPPPPPVVLPVDVPVVLEPPTDPIPPTGDPVPPPAEAAPESPVTEDPTPISAPQEEAEGPVCGNEVVEEGEECDSGPGCDVECRFNIAAFPDCRIPEDELRAMEPSELIAKYGFDEFEKCALAGGGAGAGLENAAKNPSEAGGGCSLVAAESRLSGPQGFIAISFSVIAVFAGLAFRSRQKQKGVSCNSLI